MAGLEFRHGFEGSPEPSAEVANTVLGLGAKVVAAEDQVREAQERLEAAQAEAFAFTEAHVDDGAMLVLHCVEPGSELQRMARAAVPRGD